MSDASDRFAFPYLAPGQAQKETTHNEALARIDALLHPAVEATGLNTPPPSPVPGQAWLVGPSPIGAWAGQAQALAAWTDSGWRFVAPLTGMTLWSNFEDLFLRWNGSAWVAGDLVGARLRVGGVQVVGAQQSGVADPTGGSVVDVEGRAAIAALLAAARAHGLIAP